jgi:putative ABC transport system permease protein
MVCIVIRGKQMRILLKHIIRNIKENTGRTLLIMVALFIVAVMVAFVTMGGFLMKLEMDIYKNNPLYDYQISSNTGENILDGTVEDLKEDFEILGMSDNEEHGYVVDGNGNYNSTTLNGYDLAKAVKFKFITIDGEENIELNDNEVFVTSSFAKAYNIEVGKTFVYYGVNGNKTKLKVKYIGNFSVLKQTNVKIVTNEETFIGIKGYDKMEYTTLYGNVKKSVSNIEEKIKIYENDYGLKFKEGDEVEYTDEEIDQEMITTYIYPAILIIIFVFVVIYVSVNSIVKIIINERMSTLGTFRSIGATKKQTIFILMLEMLIYTIVPAGIGALLGLGIFGKAVSDFMDLEEMQLENFSVNNYLWQILVITIGVSILFQVLLSIFELIKVSRLSITDTIFNKHISQYKYSKYKVVLGIFFLAVGIIVILKRAQLTYWYCLIRNFSIIYFNYIYSA